MKYTLRATYTDKDGKEHTEIHTTQANSMERAINAVITSFHFFKPDDKLMSVWEIKPDEVISNLKDMLQEFRNGSLVFTAEDAENVRLAINLIERMDEK